MSWRFNKSSNNEQVIISISENDIKLFLVQKSTANIQLLNSHTESYKNIKSVESICLNWLKQIDKKEISCYWVLSRSLYKTISITAPNVPDSEVDSSIKWLIKDQVEQPVSQLLVSHYSPYYQDDNNKKLTAVITDRALVESIIDITKNIQLNLVNIEISELINIGALKPLLNKDKIVGIIDQDNQGLVYNFYTGEKLAFTRHIKGRFFPSEPENDFSLESDNSQDKLDSFLLETQRTLDYCVSQIFRKPVDALIIENSKANISNLKESLEQITEIPVNVLSPNDLIEYKNDNHPLYLSIAEIGSIVNSTIKTKPLVDFYLSEFKPQPLEFDFKFSVVATLLMGVGFVSYGFVLNDEIDLLNKQLSQESKKLNHIKSTIQTLNLKSNNRIHNNIDAEIINRQNELISIKNLLKNISSNLTDKPVSYSLVLEKLSKQNIESLWLTNISLTPTSINLGGATTNPNSIPNYIDNIGQKSSLNSQFENLLLERDGDQSQIINFNISNGNYHRAD